MSLFSVSRRASARRVPVALFMTLMAFGATFLPVAGAVPKAFAISNPSVRVNSPFFGSYTPATWAPSIDWDTATDCEYSYDNATYFSLDCSAGGNDLPPPDSSGDFTLYLIASVTDGGASATSFPRMPFSYDMNIYGCTDPTADNYDPDATADDGSCTYPPPDVPGCTDASANNYDPDATSDDGSCTYDVLGCTDPAANDYDPSANVDDGSCTYDVPGCTDPAAENYDPSATVDDSSCTYAPPDVPGCTDPAANNYDPDATTDDDSCTYDPTSPVFADDSGAVTSITTSSVIVSYDLSSSGSAPITSSELDYAGDAYFNAHEGSYAENAPIRFSGSFANSGETGVNSLTCGTTYHFIQTFTNADGHSVTSDDATFQTSACGPAPDVAASEPADEETVVDWAPSVDWDVATTCSYSYDGESFTNVTCGNDGEDIPPPPAAGDTILYLKGTAAGLDESDVQVSFTYAPPPPFVFTAGDGSSESPYEVDSCDALKAVGEHLDADYYLSASLDCSSDGARIMIGTPDDPFTGTFDGSGNAITVDIETAHTDDHVGLFRMIDNGTVRDLTIDGTIAAANASNVGTLAGEIENSTLLTITASTTVTETGGDDGSMEYVGGVAGTFLDSHAEEITATGSVTSNADYVGGLFGTSGCTSEVATSSSAINVQGHDAVGGIAGSDECDGPGSFYHSVVASGNVTGNDAVGGLVGFAGFVEYELVGALGAVSGNDEVGGLIGAYDGYNQEGKIFHAAARGNVEGEDEVGGLIGVAEDGTLSQGYAEGIVTEESDERAGGLIGHAEGMTIRDSYARGDVHGGSNSLLGGFVGEAEDSHIARSYATGAPSGTDAEIGGFAGDMEGGYIVTSFWDTDTSGVSDACGSDAACGATGETTEAMKQEQTFTGAGWDFGTIWSFSEGMNDGYPYLLLGEDSPYQATVTGTPVETILDENHYHGGGVAQEWNADDDHWEYDLPFSFTFYGHTYDHAYVDSNGYLAFSEGGAIDNYNVSVQDGIGVPTIFAYGNDLVTDRGDDDIFVTDTGDGEVIFRWQATDISNDDSVANFEIVLKNDNTFEINYGPQTAPIGDATAVGASDGDGNFVASTYDGRTDFNELDTSSWAPAAEEDDTPPASPPSEPVPFMGHRSGSSTRVAPQNAGTLRATLASLLDRYHALLAQLGTQTGSTASANGDLALGATGSGVTQLQAFLIAHGDAIPAGGTGYFGAQTKAALIKYQKAHGIVPASGYFGPLTRAYMQLHP